MYFLHVVVDHQYHPWWYRHQYHPWWYRHQYHPWWYRWHQPSDNALLTIPLVLVVVLFDDECFVIYCWLNYYLWFSGLLLPLHWFRTYFQHVNIPLSLCSWCVLVLLWFYNIVSTNYNCILVYSFELLCLRYNLNLYAWYVCWYLNVCNAMMSVVALPTNVPSVALVSSMIL